MSRNIQNTYIETYEEALLFLKEIIFAFIRNCRKKGENFLIISMARKGPRILEVLKEKIVSAIMLDEEEKAILTLLEKNSYSEHALPFLFADKNMVMSLKRVLLLDDAVYFGTTLAGIYTMLKNYQQIYDVEFVIEVCAAIKNNKAKTQDFNISHLEISYKDYGHFFIKELTKDIRKLRTCMEIEFPILRFVSEEKCDNVLKKMQETLINGCPLDDIYTITHFGDVKSLNVHYTDSNEKGYPSFHKDRIYIKAENDGKSSVSIATFSPYVLPNDEYAMEHLFDNCVLSELWKSIYRQIIPTDLVIEYKDLFRCRKRSLVIMANYLLSFVGFVFTNKIWTKKCGLLYKGISDKDLHFIIKCAAKSHAFW